MDFSVIAVGDVQDVLSAMKKNLECPICLDVVEEPVSTQCDHLFCRFCMFKLLSKKKKGVIQCPLCKTEVTKRSLKENSRFKQLIEGLLETIHAFELDTGIKFLNSHHFPKTSTEAIAAESLCKESSVIQSKGFRNRKKSATENGQESCTSEANVDTQLTDTRVKRCPLRNKTRKCDSKKGIYIEFGSDSSEELFKQASNTGLEDKEVLQISSQKKLEELKSAEKGNEYSCNTQPDKLDTKEIILPSVIGEGDFSKEDLSKKSTRSITEYAKPGQVNMTEYQSSPLNVLAADLLTEKRDRIGNASPLRNGDTSFFKNTEEMNAEPTQCNSKSKEFDLKDSLESRLDKSKEIDIFVQSVEAVEMYKPENDSFHEKELPLEKLLQPETLHCATLNQVSKKRLKRSIQKVNEWFSKSNEILSSNSSQDDSAGASDVSSEGGTCLSDKHSCISEKTDPMVDSMEIAVVEGNKRFLKQTTDNIKDKIFGKTYKRERKSNSSNILREILPTTKKEDVAVDDKRFNNSSKDGLKRKRKTAHVLQPEDFIKKKDTEEPGRCPQSVNWCLGEAEKNRFDESSAVNENHLSENREDNTLAELEEGEGSLWKKATEKVTDKHCDGELELNNCDQKSTKKISSAAKRCRRSTRTMCALQLVVDRNSVSPDPAEPQIDSYPSSEEPRKVDSEQRQVRRSRRLQLLSEMTKQTGKGVVIKGARKYDSDREGSVSGVQRNLLVDASERKDLCEPRGKATHKPLAGLKGGDPEADERQMSLKNSAHAAETGRSLFNPASSCQRPNCSSFAPGAGAQEGEIRSSPFPRQSPSLTVVQIASHPTEEVIESCTPFPQDSGRDTQNVPEDFRTEKLPMAKNVSELTKEAEDSELDTQYLRNIFRHSKRLSFSLYPAPVKACAVEDAASETVKIPCADQIENKHSKYLKIENLQEEKITESLSRVCEKEKRKTYESACVSPVTCFVGNAERVRTGQDQGDVSHVANQGNLTPIRTGTARTEDKNRPQKGERENEKTVSTDDIGIESNLRQNPIESNRSQSDRSNTEEHICERTALNTVDEICFSSESNQVGKAKAVDGKGPILHFQSKSMICPAAGQQRPAEFSCDVIGKKCSERKQVKGNEGQVTQTASTGMPECLVTEALEEPLKGNSDFTGLSETPDGLLCSDDDIEENTSFSETDRRERSAVFVKRSDNALVKELHKRNVCSKPRSQGIQRSRRRAQKLQSSDEESSEDEDLPCFQALMFGTSVSTPLQINTQVTSVVESSVSPITLPHSGSHDNNNMQKMPEAALSNGCVSPSQQSEFSVNLFSSQSNMSEESVDGAQELKKPLIQVHTSKQVSTVNESTETFQSCNEGLERSKTNFKDERQEDPNMRANLGEASEDDSETSNVEDSCGPFSQGEILTTQQKNAMQNNLKKLQQEMAVLEAALKQHGSQDCEFLPVHRKLPHSSSEGTVGMEQIRQGREAESTSEGNFENHKCSSSKGFSANDLHITPSDSLNSKIKDLEKERSPELLLPSSKSCLLERLDLEKGLQSDSVLKNKAPSEKTKPVQEAVREYSQCQLEAENADKQKSGTRLNSASVLSNLSGNVTRNPNNSSSSLRLLNPQTAEATTSSVVAQNAPKSCAQEWKSERSVSCPLSVLHNAAGKENATSPVVTNRKEMSIVASGLNQSEHLVIQKFARKTRSTLSNHITEGTTHVIMKTDKDLVCERTLKYFLGIAGRKWVVSYQWVIQSFREGRILDEENFEVRGDVINGRNHQGPKRARQSLTEKIFKGFEICCCGPFTDMTTEHLEWMVELCGASVVKQLHLFTRKPNSTAVVVVQPDAWMENTDYRAIQQKNNVAMVTREWVLDSVACYACQELDAYLVS